MHIIRFVIIPLKHDSHVSIRSSRAFRKPKWTLVDEPSCCTRWVDCFVPCAFLRLPVSHSSLSSGEASRHVARCRQQQSSSSISSVSTTFKIAFCGLVFARTRGGGSLAFVACFYPATPALMGKR